MAEIKTYFFDSYAFYEVLTGNENYKPFTKNIAIVTTKLNLMELHYGMLVQHGKEVADKIYNDYSKFSVEVSDEVIKKANELRFCLRERKLSYVDCIGYIIARLRNIPFLTGDKQFKDMENVEFVK